MLQWITTNTKVTRNEKPMVHFCFDQFQRGSDELVTVALYCPRLLAKHIHPVHKCCPKGEQTVQFLIRCVSQPSRVFLPQERVSKMVKIALLLFCH